MQTPLSDERVTGYTNGTLVIHPPDVQSMAQELMARRAADPLDTANRSERCITGKMWVPELDHLPEGSH